ncbi:MAG: lipopolysaccharide biosynthesis protein [Sarcina sp.]
MRLKKSIINALGGMLAYMLAFLPLFAVRKVFIDTLGAQVLGLSSLYSNIVGYLSIVEMGIGVAIICCLYKPFADDDREKVKGYLNYYEKFYKLIAAVILIGGIAITPFLHTFIEGNISMTLVRVGFILFVLNAVVTYTFGYKQCMLNVAQESYKVSIAMTISKIIIAFGQIYILEKYHSFYAYLIIQIVVNLICNVLINMYIDKKYPWLRKTKGKLNKEEKKDLRVFIKAVFMHKIGGAIVLGTDNIVVSAFIGLTSVAAYNNYMLIITALTGVVEQIMTGITASIGNLLLENNKELEYKTHKRMFLVNFWIASLIAIVLFNTLDSFIELWVGKVFVLGGLTVGLLIFNMYFKMMRGQIEEFKNASGEFHKDRYAPLVEGAINLIFSIVFVKLIGLPGVFLGTAISNLTVIFWTQPYIVYKYVFKKGLFEYFTRYIGYFIIGLIPLFITLFLTKDLRTNVTIGGFILNCIISFGFVNIFYIIIFWKKEEFKYFRDLALRILKLKKI